ncbi:MAG TPA: glycine oxidase ThiO [Alphaproteobacteria bacterium]
MPRVAVIGGGIIGLSIAWRLASAGCHVDVYERGEPGRGATWAAAGMLAAGAEAEPGEEALFALNRLSQQRWPAFARALAEASGIDVGYRDEGTLRIALNRDDAAKLRTTCEFQQRLGVELEWLDGPAARPLEPHLAPGVVAAVLSRHDHQVDNRCVAPALVAAVTAAGGRIHARTAVEEIAIAHGRVVGVAVGGAVVAADVVVLAAGAWSREIAGIPPALRPPVRPVKGQMIALRMDPAAPLVRHVVWAPRAYLVPRRDGRLLVGATVEERGFDPALTAGAMLALLEGAWRAMPALEELPIDETWCGFRPGSRDDAPILGPCEIDGLVFATGHHRNGILLAPATADVISRLVLTGEMDPAARPFGLDRFTKPPVRRETA